MTSAARQFAARCAVRLAVLAAFAGGARPAPAQAAAQPAQRPAPAGGAVLHLRMPGGAPLPPLRVCADPNNLPFSNDREEGFENRLAALMAHGLGTTLEYAWRPQRRGFVRNTLNEGRCDLIVGVPAGYDPVRTTAPYYRSTYVFVYRTDRGYHITSLADSALRRLRIGIHLAGDENPPPAQALAARGIIDNVRGYSIYGDYSQPNPPARLVEAVAKGDVDVAIAWGPLAGYFARRQRVPLTIVPVPPASDVSGQQWSFDIAMGVRHRDAGLAAALDRLLDADREEIRRILDDYGVPLVKDGDARSASQRGGRP